MLNNGSGYVWKLWVAVSWKPLLYAYAYNFELYQLTNFQMRLYSTTLKKLNLVLASGIVSHISHEFNLLDVNTSISNTIYTTDDSVFMFWFRTSPDVWSQVNGLSSNVKRDKNMGFSLRKVCTFSENCYVRTNSRCVYQRKTNVTTMLY